ncbi:MAG: phage holin family protein [Saprospiraceae bacterium]|nr:phage holin family protein [Saprospiraceae bacterium]
MTYSDQVLPDKDFFLSALHIRTYPDIVFNLFLTITGAMIGYLSILVMDNQDAFIAILGVVLLDWVFGMAKAVVTKLPNGKSSFEIKKAMRFVYYIATYWSLLAVMLTIERGFSFASWLSEAIMLPIIVFQMISVLKNASHLNLIPKGVLLQILENIDNYKDQIRERQLSGQIIEPEIIENTENEEGKNLHR